MLMHCHSAISANHTKAPLGLSTNVESLEWVHQVSVHLVNTSIHTDCLHTQAFARHAVQFSDTIICF